MDPIKREREGEEWLDFALSQYGKAEPREGLEGRVLANLRVERNRMAAPSGWWWLAAATALAAMVVAAWFWQSGRVARPGSAAGMVATEREGLGLIEPPRDPQIARPDGAAAAKQVAIRRPGRKSSRDLIAAAPKLDQFPSPRPLSEQEQILMSYVARYPETAVLLAQAQAEALERDRDEAAQAGKGDTE